MSEGLSILACFKRGKSERSFRHFNQFGFVCSPVEPALATLATISLAGGAVLEYSKTGQQLLIWFPVANPPPHARENYRVRPLRCQSLGEGLQSRKGKVDKSYAVTKAVTSRTALVYPSTSTRYCTLRMAESKQTHERGSVAGAFGCPCVAPSNGIMPPVNDLDPQPSS